MKTQKTLTTQIIEFIYVGGFLSLFTFTLIQIINH
jgi:hypothetical protein